MSFHFIIAFHILHFDYVVAVLVAQNMSFYDMAHMIRQSAIMYIANFKLLGIVFMGLFNLYSWLYFSL